MRAVLHRFADTPFGVFGFLDLYDDRNILVGRFCTAEDDWLWNQRNISAIAPGDYTARRFASLKFGPTFEIVGVPNRAAILLHAGNSEEDVQGCVLLGEEFGALSVRDEDDPAKPWRQKWAVVRSREAMARFRSLTAGLREFPISVLWSRPGGWRIDETPPDSPLPAAA